MNAEEARRIYNKPYTLDEILAHIEARAVDSVSVYGYKQERLSPDVETALWKLGFDVVIDNGSVTITWA